MKYLFLIITVLSVVWAESANALDCLSYFQVDSDQQTAIAAATSELEEDIAVEEAERKYEVALATYWEVKDAAREVWSEAKRSAHRAYNEALEEENPHKSAEQAYFEVMDPAQVEYDRAVDPVSAVLEKATNAVHEAKRQRVAAIEVIRERINAETEDKYMKIYAAGRDLGDYSREIVLKMAMKERRLCSE